MSYDNELSQEIFVTLIIMAKAAKKKSAKEASNIFHGIMGASVAGNPKPKQKATKKQ